MKVSLFSANDFEKPHLKEANGDRHQLVWFEEPLEEGSVDKVEDCDAVLAFTNDDLNEDVLDKLKEKGVKYIATRSAGTDHIDLEHAKELDLKVANAPRYSPYAVAEHAVGMLLALNRKLIEANKKISRQNFELHGLIGFDLHGKTAGILGTGKIGAVSTRILNGFGCNILLWDKVKKEELTKKYNASYVALDELFKKSDFIFIHLPLNEETRHLIQKKNLQKMKDGVILINVGRGAIIHTADLIEALKSGKVGKAGLDVYEKEGALFFDDNSEEPLKDEDFAYLQMNNDVLITGHQAFATEEALQNIADTTFENINSWEAGEAAENEL